MWRVSLENASANQRPPLTRWPSALQARHPGVVRSVLRLKLERELFGSLGFLSPRHPKTSPQTESWLAPWRAGRVSLRPPPAWRTQHPAMTVSKISGFFRLLNRNVNSFKYSGGYFAETSWQIADDPALQQRPERFDPLHMNAPTQAAERVRALDISLGESARERRNAVKRLETVPGRRSDRCAHRDCSVRGASSASKRALILDRNRESSASGRIRARPNE